jgi:hypothetical protein
MSPRTRDRVLDGRVRVYMSSLCSCNTERTKTRISANSCNRSVASYETGIEGRMLNSWYGDS